MKKTPLTVAIIRAATATATEYQLIDGEGLRLRVLPSGTKTWAVRIATPAGTRQITLGDWPTMGLPEARAAAATARAAAKKDDDRADLHTDARAALVALLGVFNTLHDRLGRPVEVDDLLRLLRSKPRE